MQRKERPSTMFVKPGLTVDGVVNSILISCFENIHYVTKC